MRLSGDDRVNFITFAAMTLIKDVLKTLEAFAPLNYQESYDNAGLIVGDSSAKVTGIIICLDSIEAVVDEAIETGCNLIIAHHPIVFSGLKKLNGKNYIERTVIKAIKNDIAIYAAHTNLDNIAEGVNKMICAKLGLHHTEILQPKKTILKKLVTFVPEANATEVRNALFKAGAGKIGNYENCSFNIPGTGTFKGNEASEPVLGEKGVEHHESEIRIEVIFEAYKQSQILAALFKIHPYEEVAFDIYMLENEYQNIGSGMVGYLPEPMDEMAFLQKLKTVMKTSTVRHTALTGKKVEKIALCGGSGSFLLNDAIRTEAQVFITADFKYHQFFDADGRIVIADIGHFESEQYTMELFYSLISKNFNTFAVRLTEVRTNPVYYL